MNITVRQLESTGMGIIRSEHIKNTLTGRIYKATIYYEDKSVDVAILYYRHGGSKVLGPVINSETDTKQFIDFLEYAMPRLPRKSKFLLRYIGAAIAFSMVTTIVNITSTVNTFGLAMDMADILMTVFLITLYIRERRRYERQ